jgi:hypothetical protein
MNIGALKLGDIQLTIIKKLREFEERFGFEPTALLLGPEFYLRLSTEVKQQNPNIVNLSGFVGLPIRVKTEPGFEFEIPLDKVARFACK